MYSGKTLVSERGADRLHGSQWDPPCRRRDEPAAQEEKKDIRANIEVIAVAAPGKHWIGIHAVPVSDEALKSQLNLKQDRLIVVQVVPDSPSAKAGVKQHDILIRFADKELSTLEDLIKAVNDNGDKEVQLEVLRGGKSSTLTIQPSERPADGEIAITRTTMPQNLRAFIEEAQGEGDGKGKYTLRMFGPGIAAARAFAIGHAEAFPNGLSLSVTKENDQPAKIVAKKDGKTYETTEDKLADLPADIRSHVERLFAKPHTMAFSLSDLKDLDVDGAKIHAEVRKAVESAKKQAEEGQTRRVEVRRIEGGPLDELRKEVDALRKEIEKLKNEKD
jgi:hypothetical protein